MEYYVPLFTCLFFLFLFHFLFIKWVPKSKRFWKKVDYWWVSFGIVGIIGATYSYRKESSIALQPWHKESLTAVFNEFKDGIQNQCENYSDTLNTVYIFFKSGN